MNHKYLFAFLVCVLSIAVLAGCATASTTQANNSSAVVEASVQATVEASRNAQAATDNDSAASVSVASVETTSNESTEQISYTAQGDEINLSDYEANAVVSITTAGEYTLSGTLNGQVVVNVGDEETVQLYLNNAEITNSRGSAILVQNAEEVIITLNDGTVNTITDGANYANVDESGEPNAAIFSHDDLTVNGNGSLTIQANYADGIQSRDDLKISGGTITITAVDDGLFGNNSFEMKNAVVVITASGDTIHSDGDIIIESGTLTLNSGDDAMHADGTITINDGIINIQNSYEGIEATNIIVNGGTIDIISSDDGINGAGGNDSSGTSGPGGRPQDNFSGTQASITINGGTITIEAGTSGNGDGLDANGTITITGGDTVIKTPSSYRDYTDIDYDTSFSLTGGSVRILNANGTYTEVTSNYSSNGGHGGRP